MKLKEKLAKEHAEESGDETDASSFLAGFEKARELIKQALIAELGSEEALKTIGFPFNLGEEEVE